MENCITPPSKPCSKCKLDKPLTRFGAHKFTKDKLQSMCKDCFAEASRNRSRILAARTYVDTPEHKVCPCCSQDLPSSEFRTNNSNKDGLSCYCRNCDKIKRAIYQRNLRNREHIAFPKSKKCSKCGIEKPTLAFFTDKSCRSGLSSCCIECADLRKLNKKHDEILAQFPASGILQTKDGFYGQTCVTCGDFKLMEYFNGGHNATCRDCWLKFIANGYKLPE